MRLLGSLLAMMTFSFGSFLSSYPFRITKNKSFFRRNLFIMNNRLFFKY